MKWLPTLLCCLLVALQASAANYFVDYAAGSDSAAGTSTSVPWKHCPGDACATSTPLAASLAAGDTVFFKGGVTYSLNATNPNPAYTTVPNGYNIAQGIAGISNLWNGTTGNPITYDGNSAGSWGTGRAVITDNFSTNNICAFFNPTMTNITFNSFIFTNIGGSNVFPGGDFSAHDGFPPKPGYGISAVTVDHVSILNCYFGELGYYQYFPTNMGNQTLYGFGLSIANCSTLVVSNCEFAQIRKPILLGNGNLWNITIISNYFHDEMEWGFAAITSDPAQYRSNFFIIGNKWLNTDQYYIDHSLGGQWVGYPVTATNGGGPHQNGIMMYNSENGGDGYDRSPGDTNVLIYGNTMVATLGYPGGSTSIWLQDGTSGYIYNNVFGLCGSADGTMSVTVNCTNTPVKVGIYNNTFYGGGISMSITGSHNSSLDTPGQNFWRSTIVGNVVDARNNVFSTLNVGNQNAVDYTVNCITNLKTIYVTNAVIINNNYYFSDQIDSFGPLMVLATWTGIDPSPFVATPQQMGLGTTINPGTGNSNTISLLVFGNWDYTSATTNAPPFISPVHVAPFNFDLHLVTNSPALTAGVNLTSLNLPGLNTDFDGNTRPASGSWAIGAYGAGAIGGGGGGAPTPVWCCR